MAKELYLQIFQEALDKFSYKLEGFKRWHSYYVGIGETSEEYDKYVISLKKALEELSKRFNDIV